MSFQEPTGPPPLFRNGVAVSEPGGPPPSSFKPILAAPMKEPDEPPPKAFVGGPITLQVLRITADDCQQESEGNNEKLDASNSLTSRKRTWEAVEDQTNHQKENNLEQTGEIRNDEIDVEDEQETESFTYVPPSFAPLEELNPGRLAQRQKQLDMGKNTVGYQNYTDNVPKHLRQKFNKIHPVTPDTKQLCSKRCFDGLVRAWRRQLHYWDVLPGQSAAHQAIIPIRKRVKVMASTTKSEQTDVTMKDEALTENRQPTHYLFDDLDL